MLVLATEILKVKIRILPDLSIFQFLNKLYDLGNACMLYRKKTKTAYNSGENLSSLSPKIWELILKRELHLQFPKRNLKTKVTS